MRAIYALLIIVVLAVAGGLCYLLLCDRPPSLPTGQVPAPPVDVGNLPTVDLADGPPPARDAIVFDMAYRGLTGDKDDLRYNAYWGFGGSSDADTPFPKAVRQTAGEKVKTVYNPNFKGAEWAAVEMKGDLPTALYFDLNADGELADYERILPRGKPDQYGQVDFVTPDFLMTTQKGVQTPFRALLQARTGGSATWSPSCVLQGAASVDGRDLKLLLYCNGFTGSFVEFGGCSYSLKQADAPLEPYTPRQPLSSLITFEDQFYKLRFLKHPDEAGRIQSVIEKDTTPTGRLAIKLIGRQEVKARLSSARISGAEDNTIQFNVSGARGVTLPQGAYKLNSGYVYYGVDEARVEEAQESHYVNFTKGPQATIVAGETLTVELGQPRMIVSAIDQQQRYNSNAQESTVFTKGTNVFLSPKVGGLAGEQYGRFRDERNDLVPTVEILATDGKRIASSKMEYG
ncbi:MAG: hypothetical protein IH624_08490 [Phycisphaerae bacterium]|nr:hypothetical protein [Phycisphaerae bacterium]